MKLLVSFIQKIEKYLMAGLAFLPLVLVLLICYVVFTRYILETGSIALQESAIYIFGFIIMAAAGVTYSANDHVRIDAFSYLLSKKHQWLVEQLGIIFFIVPFCLLIIWLSLDFVLLSWKFLETSADSNGLKFTYIQKTFILMFPVLLLLSSVKLFIINSFNNPFFQPQNRQ